MKGFLSLLAWVAAVSAAPLQPWNDPQCNAVNREPMHTSFTADRVPMVLDGVWEFRLGEKGEWKSIPVPSVWEMNGFADPVYVCNGYPWKWYFQNNPPEIPTEGNVTGFYRKIVHVPEGWTGGDDVFLKVGAASSNVSVSLNGMFVGYSEDSRLEAVFDIGGNLHEGDNLLEFEVMRWCDGTYLEDQDMWRMSGIFRSVSIERRPRVRMKDIRVTASADGSLETLLWPSRGASRARLTLRSPKGRKVSSWSVDLNDTLVRDRRKIRHPKLWSAETPWLYTLSVQVMDNAGGISETLSVETGFRDVRVVGKQLLINGKPVLIKGVNRHEMSPTGGFHLTREEMEADICLLKRLNVNAVRTSHYPDDPYWYTLCDRYGIYVMDEANIESHGIGYDADRTLADKSRWALSHAERFQRMVRRDFNHPSVIIWSLGNEAGNGAGHAANYMWAKKTDPSRPVIYQKLKAAREELPYTDMELYHYRTPEFCEAYLTDGKQTKPFMLQEYAHAMGNSLGNFAEYWDLVRRYDGFQGGFIWDFADQALLRDGKTFIGGDFNDHDPWNASLNCNGLLTSDRKYHPHAYEAAHVMRNILSSASPEDAAKGRITVKTSSFSET